MIAPPSWSYGAGPRFALRVSRWHTSAQSVRPPRAGEISFLLPRDHKHFPNCDANYLSPESAPRADVAAHSLCRGGRLHMPSARSARRGAYTEPIVLPGGVWVTATACNTTSVSGSVLSAQTPRGSVPLRSRADQQCSCSGRRKCTRAVAPGCTLDSTGRNTVQLRRAASGPLPRHTPIQTRERHNICRSVG